MITVILFPAQVTSVLLGPGLPLRHCTTTIQLETVFVLATLLAVNVSPAISVLRVLMNPQLALKETTVELLVPYFEFLLVMIIVEI